ncbi:MAG: hypothetical protein ISR91_00570 [Candidatus Delongbacteria bacterium]|nr:hypothetical protein [Candidatus Delongbacteria bacterium]
MDKASLCEPILRSLPEWFGIEEATRSYLADIEIMPTFLATRVGDLIGFLTFKLHTEKAAEIQVMGVRPETIAPMQGAVWSIRPSCIFVTRVLSIYR